MKYTLLLSFIFLFVSGCKREDTQPRLAFSKEERKWFIYQRGQEFRFKNPTGDSIVFTVDSVCNYFSTEYGGTINNPVELGNGEFYEVYLSGNDDANPINDFIYITFYKDLQLNSRADKMQQTITWHKVIGQYVEIENIKNQATLVSRTINNITYNKVSAAVPTNDLPAPWTKWEGAYYDQQSGFIELIDTSGTSWLRQ